MRKLLFILLLCLPFLLAAQDDAPKKWALNGYVSYMGAYAYSDLFNMETVDHNLHNRLNFDWYPNDKLTGSLQMRNRFFIGDQMKADVTDASKDAMEDDILAVNLAQGDMFVLNSMIDRLNFKYSINKLDVTVGRQRINWGQTFVFNANDIFNAYSFVDFDYPERPGSDAVRIQYYPSYTSTIEGAVKYTNDSTITAAALTRFSKWGYDIQLMGGMYNSKEWVVGGGWSGSIKSVSFSGEVTYLHPNENFKNASGLFFASMNLNYTFSNSLMLQIEGFYNQYVAKNSLSFLDLMSAQQDIKTLSLSEYTIFGSVAYPITPLLSANFSSMYYPDINGVLIFPSVDVSVSDDIQLSLIAMYFKGDFELAPTINQNGEMFYGFLRMKYAF